jgi:phosphatidylglycerophosphatase A
LIQPASGPEEHGQSLGRRLGVFVATCGYVGYAPIAPGTFGSAAGLAVYAAVRLTGSTTVELATIVILFAIGVWAGTIAEHHFGGVDPGPVVMDEVVGMLITLALLPVNMTGAIVGFFVFRALDVVKPWPSGGFEKLPGGLGVMADDGMAAIYGNLVMRGLIWVTPAGWLV